MEKQVIATLQLKRLLAGLLLIISVAIIPATGSFSADSGTPEEKPYSVLLDNLKRGVGPVDFQALRIAYAKTPEYNPYSGDKDTSSNMYRALNEKKYEEALSYAQKILDRNYVDIDAHYVSVNAYSILGNQEQSKFHRFFFRGLIESIMESGDGLSPETARVVINIQEEYIILSVLRLKLSKQQLIHLNGHDYDKMTIVDKEKGDAKELYFNVDLPYKWLKKR